MKKGLLRKHIAAFLAGIKKDPDKYIRVRSAVPLGFARRHGEGSAARWATNGIGVSGGCGPRLR